MKKLLLVSSSPMMYPHILGVFEVIKSRYDRGEPILTDEESAKGDALLKILTE